MSGLRGLTLLWQATEFGDGAEVTALVGGLLAEQAPEDVRTGAIVLVTGTEGLG